MKIRYKIIIIVVIIVIVIFWLRSESSFGQPECLDELITKDYDCSLWSNLDWIYYNIIKGDIVKSEYPAPCAGCQDNEIVYPFPCFSDKVDPIHGVIIANETHQFNPVTCQWEEYVPIVTPHPVSDCFLIQYWDGEKCVDTEFVYPGAATIFNSTIAACIDNNIEYIDNPNNPGEKIPNLGSIEKCY